MEETTTETLTLAGDSLPLDLIAEILCRFPVKFLLQLRCVCKSWNTLISKDPNFAKKHLRMSPTKRHLFFTSQWIITTTISYPLDSLHLDAIFTSNPTPLDYSLIHPKYYNHLITSCDGIFCFAVDNTLAALWNPTVRKFKELPSLDIPPKRGRTIYAFGYDPFIDNYKVVSVFSYDFEYRGIRIKGCKTQVNFHTLGSNSWRRIQDFPSTMIPCGNEGIFVSGTVNWFADFNANTSTQAIVSLHLAKESYQEISQPDYGMSNNLTLGIMKDCLCVFSRSHSLIDVWLMKEYGNKESWIKLIHLPFFPSLGRYSQEHKIIYISEDDNNVLFLFTDFSNLKWVVYDPKYDTTKTIKIEDFSWVDSKVYVESLLSPEF